MADAGGTFTFRHDPAGGGALADLGIHKMATAELPLGPIAEVMGDCITMIDDSVARRLVRADDVGRAFLSIANGVGGSIDGNWISTGRKMKRDLDVFDSKGALPFSQERFNQLHHYSVEDASGRPGFRRIEAAPAHPPYVMFFAAPGHQIGFNDLKSIAVAVYLEAINGDRPEPFNFRSGMRIQALVEPIQRSARERNQLSVES